MTFDQVLFGSVEEIKKETQGGEGIFLDSAISFVDALATQLSYENHSVRLPDIASFTFWARKSNLETYKRQYFETSKNRIGRGCVFHITPKNVPTNFLYSMVFGILSGNCNIIRVPSSRFPQIDMTISALRNLSKVQEFSRYLSRLCLVQYERDDEITIKYMSASDFCVFWGSNETIEHLRKLPRPANCGELSFPTKYSASMISLKRLRSLDQTQLKLMVNRFFTDSFLFDQNGCSSPRLIYWILDDETPRAITEDFWKTLESIARNKYDLDESLAIRKFSELCSIVLGKGTVSNFRQYGNYVYVLEVNLEDLMDSNMEVKYGTFYEVFISNPVEILGSINKNYQTITYFGFTKEDLERLSFSGFTGSPDRFTPLGEAFTMDFIWDGNDIPLVLSKTISLK